MAVERPPRISCARGGVAAGTRPCDLAVPDAGRLADAGSRLRRAGRFTNRPSRRIGALRPAPTAQCPPPTALRPARAEQDPNNSATRNRSAAATVCWLVWPVCLAWFLPGGRTVNRRSTTAEPPPAAGVAPAADAAPAGPDAGRDPLLSLRDRIAADGPQRGHWWRPRLASPALWLLDEPLLFGAVLVAVLLLGLALGARLFHSPDERRLIVPTVVVQTNPPLLPTAPAPRIVPPAPPIATEAPTVAATPAATTRPGVPPPPPTIAPGRASATPAPADVPPPPAGSSLSNLVNGAARQPAPAGVPSQAGVPPPAAGFAPGAAASGGARTAAGAPAAGGAATTTEPPDLDAALQSVAAQGQRAATAAAGRGPLPSVAPPRPAPAQPTAQP